MFKTKAQKTVFKAQALLLSAVFTLVWLAGNLFFAPAARVNAVGPYDHTYYVSASGDDTAGDGTQANPWATLAKTANVINTAGKGANNLVVVMTDLTSTACARYYDNSVTIMSGDGGPYTVTRGTGFASISDVVRSWYNPAMLEIDVADVSTASPVSLTLSDITFNDAYRYEGSAFGYANNTTGLTCVQDSIVASYDGHCTIILDAGATLANFGGMSAIRCAGGNVVMNPGSLITDIGATNTTRQTTTSATNWVANGEAAVSVNYGSFFMYAGAQITNIANAHAVKFQGSYQCFLDGEIANMIGNKGMDTNGTVDGRGLKNAVLFNGPTLSPGSYDPATGEIVPAATAGAGSAIIGKNAYIHNNLIKCGAVCINRNGAATVEIYGKVNNNTGGTGSTLNLAGTNGGGLYIVAGGTIILEDGSELIGNKVVTTAYGGAASIQQYNS
ncbi:MAG: hypothetical protein FWF49_06100, partial [Oscillospiraceae bacterium]|nr:hypothetical protein [Oscillospiraceae bacterium]